MNRDQRAASLGVATGPTSPVMSQCVEMRGLLFTSGHTSDTLGTVGDNISLEEGQEAAREAVRRLLFSIQQEHGTLEGLSIVQLSVFVNCTPHFTQHGDIANAASALLQSVFVDDRPPTRKALGHVSLPRGVAVEVDAILMAHD